MTNTNEYQICLERSHESDGSFVSHAVHNALSWTTCKHCGTPYAIENKTFIHEKIDGEDVVREL